MFGQPSVGSKPKGLLFVWGSNSAGQVGDGTTTDRWGSPVAIGTNRWKQIATNRNTTPSGYSMAIRDDGALFAWGENGSGQLGLGDISPRSSPVQVGSSSWAFVSIGSTVTLAIRIDGALFAWGANNIGQLGLGDTTNRSSPVQVGASSWAFANAGSSSCFGIRVGGSLFAWGSNNFGELGLGDTTNRSSPVQVGASSWSFVDSKGDHTAAIRVGGALFTWGLNGGTDGTGQLGLGDTTDRSSPVQVGSSSWAFVATSRFSTLAIRIDGLLFGWGFDVSDMIERGYDIASSVSSPVQIGSRRWKKAYPTSLSGGSLQQNEGGFIGIDESGYAYAGGKGTWFDTGGLSTFDITIKGWTLVAQHNSQTSPVLQGSHSWSMVSGHGGGWNKRGVMAGIRSDGALMVWGENNRGMLGLGDELARYIPTQVGNSSWTMVSVGSTHMAAIRVGGALFTWGAGTNEMGSSGNGPFYEGDGALGLGDTADRSSPTQVGSSSWTFVKAALGCTYAIRVGGALFSWGANASGALGLGDITSRSSPVQVGSSSWAFIGAGDGFALGIRIGGSLFSWGYNGFGQLGLGDITSRSSPVQVGASSWSFVDAGEIIAGAIRIDGALFMWGHGGLGKLGLGDQVARSSPVQVGASSWTAVACGQGYTIGVRSDGTLFGWGSNRMSQLGIAGSPSDGSSSPVQIGAATDWASVAVCPFDNFGWGGSGAALKTNGLLYVWGSNAYGNLGIAKIAPKKWKDIQSSGGLSPHYIGITG